MPAWIVGMLAFVILFHIIKEGYTARVLHFWNRPESVTPWHVVSPRAFLFNTRGALGAGANSILTTRGSIYQLTHIKRIVSWWIAKNR